MLKTLRGYHLTGDEVVKAYHGLLHFKDSLDKYSHWLKDKDFKPLPGFEEAIKQVQDEAKEYQELISKIYVECFIPTQP